MPRDRVAAPAVVPQLGDPLPGRRLLVIDNEESILLSMAALLEQWGCTVVTATDEQSALTALDGVAQDAILADYHLDHALTGWAVVLAVRGRSHQALQGVMITSARSD